MNKLKIILLVASLLFLSACDTNGVSKKQQRNAAKYLEDKYQDSFEYSYSSYDHSGMLPFKVKGNRTGDEDFTFISKDGKEVKVTWDDKAEKFSDNFEYELFNAKLTEDFKSMFLNIGYPVYLFRSAVGNYKDSYDYYLLDDGFHGETLTTVPKFRGSNFTYKCSFQQYTDASECSSFETGGGGFINYEDSPGMLIVATPDDVKDLEHKISLIFEENEAYKFSNYNIGIIHLDYFKDLSPAGVQKMITISAAKETNIFLEIIYQDGQCQINDIQNLGKDQT